MRDEKTKINVTENKKKIKTGPGEEMNGTSGAEEEPAAVATTIPEALLALAKEARGAMQVDLVTLGGRVTVYICINRS
jgi:hypothetical protein